MLDVVFVAGGVSIVVVVIIVSRPSL